MALLLWLLVFLVVCVVLGMFVIQSLRERKRPMLIDPGMKFFSPETVGGFGVFPSIVDDATIDLSVIVPAYNEEKRICGMLDEALADLRQCKDISWEVIVVDDGSRDGTASLVEERYVRPLGSSLIRLLRLPRNRGKGGAVRCGALCSRGNYVLMCDADGASRFSEWRSLHKSLQKGAGGVAVGSRQGADGTERKTAIRTALAWGFRKVTEWVGVGGVRDTQCGFKMFSRKAARTLFRTMHVERWAFDVELLWLAHHLKYPIHEVVIEWHDKEGSKLDPLWATIEMVRDMLKIRFFYAFGLWKVWKD